jgi:hypothetical protein
MTKNWLMLPLAILLLALAAAGADIGGTWKGTAQSPAGPVERTFNFKVDGNKLTGDSTSDMFGKSDIQDGKIDGDTISFVLTLSVQGNDVKANYTGKVEGDQIKLTVTVQGLDQTIEYTVTRVTESKQSPAGAGPSK